jgi:hypothetical protein
MTTMSERAEQWSAEQLAQDCIMYVGKPMTAHQCAFAEFAATARGLDLSDPAYAQWYLVGVKAAGLWERYRAMRHSNRVAEVLGVLGERHAGRDPFLSLAAASCREAGTLLEEGRSDHTAFAVGVEAQRLYAQFQAAKHHARQSPTTAANTDAARPPGSATPSLANSTRPDAVSAPLDEFDRFSGGEAGAARRLRELGFTVHSTVPGRGTTTEARRQAAVTSVPMMGQSPTAFIAWVHAEADWTQTQREDWAETVAQFAGALTLHGVDTDVDLYHLTEPGTDWTRYGPQAIENADFILVAVSQAWIRRFDGTEDPTVGAGASQEANALQGIFQRDRDEFRRRVILVYLPGADTDDVPLTLHNVLRFTLPALARPHLDDLLRALYRRPKYVRPALGEAPDFDVSSPVPENMEPTVESTRDGLMAFQAGLSNRLDPEAAATVRGIAAALDADPANDAPKRAAALTPALPAGPIRYRSQFLLPPQGHPNTWQTEPLLRLRVATIIGPATVDTVGRLGPRIHRAVINSLDSSQLSKSLRTLTRRHVPVLADGGTVAPIGRQHLGEWQIADDDHLTGDHAAYRLGGDASSGIVGFVSVSLPAFTHAGQVNLVLDVGISVAEPVSILAVGRLLTDELLAVHEAAGALSPALPGDARAWLAGITLTAPRTVGGQHRPNRIDQRIDFSPMGEHTRELNMDIGITFDLWPGFAASDAASVIVGAIEAMMVDAGFLDPTDGIDELATRLGVSH